MPVRIQRTNGRACASHIRSSGKTSNFAIVAAVVCLIFVSSPEKLSTSPSSCTSIWTPSPMSTQYALTEFTRPRMSGFSACPTVISGAGCRYCLGLHPGCVPASVVRPYDGGSHHGKIREGALRFRSVQENLRTFFGNQLCNLQIGQLCTRFAERSVRVNIEDHPLADERLVDRLKSLVPLLHLRRDQLLDG